MSELGNVLRKAWVGSIALDEPISRHCTRTAPFLWKEIHVKFILFLIVTSLVACLAPNVALADCNPPCKGNRVCRYDSTHNPQFFCRKPAAAPSAANASPAASRPNEATKRTGPSKPKNAQYNPKELSVDYRNSRPRNGSGPK